MSLSLLLSVTVSLIAFLILKLLSLGLSVSTGVIALLVSLYVAVTALLSVSWLSTPACRCALYNCVIRPWCVISV